MVLSVQKCVLAPALVTAVFAAGAFYAAPAVSHTHYSAAYCQNYAREVSLYYSRGGAVGGAVRGGLGGAAVGAIVGGSHGARKGAAIGAVAGGTARAVQRGVSYDVVYRDCMRGYFPHY